MLCQLRAGKFVYSMMFFLKYLALCTQSFTKAVCNQERVSQWLLFGIFVQKLPLVPRIEICLKYFFDKKIPRSSHCGTVNCTVNGQYFAFELLELTQDCIFKADNPQRTILTGKVRIDATGNFLFNLLQKRKKIVKTK